MNGNYESEIKNQMLSSQAIVNIRFLYQFDFLIVRNEDCHCEESFDGVYPEQSRRAG